MRKDMTRTKVPRVKAHSTKRTCPSVEMRHLHGKWSLASPEAQRFVQLIEAWRETGDRLPTHSITINLLPDGPVANFKGTLCGRRERLFGELGHDHGIAWRHVWVMERGEVTRFFPHVHLLIWLPPIPEFRRQLWAFLVKRFKIEVPIGKVPWHVLNSKGKGYPVNVHLISRRHRPNSRTGRTWLFGLTDYLVKEIDRNAFEPGMKAKLGDLVGASAEIIKVQSSAGLSRPRLRLREIPLMASPTPTSYVEGGLNE